jgi:hypothetical protein
MTIQIGRKLSPPRGYSLLLDASIPESYSGSSTWSDLSNQSNNLSLANSPTFSRTSFGGGQLSFNGANQYGSLSEIGLGGSFTISAWVKKSDTSSTGWIVGSGWVATTDSAGLGVGFGIQGSTLTLTTWGNPGYITWNGIEANKWYHLCAVQNAGPDYHPGPWVAKVFVNGSQVTSGGFYNYNYYTTGGAATSYIGRNSHSSIDSYNYFGGAMGQILIYNSQALSNAQVVEIFGQTRGRYGI